MNNTFYKKYTQQILFGVLITFYLFIFFIYSLEQCYPRIGFAGVYGICIGISFLFAGFFLKEDFKRLEKDNILKPLKNKTNVNNRNKRISLIFNYLFTFFIGYQIAYILDGHYGDLVDNPANVIFSLHLSDFKLLYPIEGILLIIISIIISNKEHEEDDKVRKLIYPHELIFNFAIAAGIGGILGAKLLFVFTESGDFFEKLFSTSGLTFYGGLIGGATSVILYAKKLKLPILKIADCFAPILMLAYSIGRMGCQLAGDGCWGVKNEHSHSFLPDWIWSNQYIGAIHGQPYTDVNGNDFYEEGIDIIFAVFPTSVYETIICFICFLFLWFIRKKIKIAGLLFSIYLMLNGIERFFIEKIRVNPNVSDSIQFTQAQIVGIILFIIGLIGFAYLIKRKNDTKRSFEKI